MIVRFCQNKQNGGQAKFKHKRNCSGGNRVALKKYEQRTKFWLKVWQEWNMMFTLRIVAYMQEQNKALQSLRCFW